MPSREKVVSLRDAAARIPPGARVAFGGNIMRRQVNAFARELIRQRIGDLTIYSFAGGFAVDMLAAAGLLKRYEGVYAGLFWHGLAPSFRRGVEAGAIEVRDYSESAQVARFQAACNGNSFMPIRALLGTDMAKQDPEITVEMTCPFTGRSYTAMRAIEPDFTVIHGYTADAYGNVQWPLARDADDVDQIIARGSNRLIVTVERIVPHEEVKANPHLTYIPSQWVEAVVEVPFGAHPLACDTVHDEDEEAIRAYAAAGRTAAGAADYLDKYVHVGSHEAYLDAFGGLAALKARLGVGR
ncbi:CoA transferase subunit A [Propylenella binzhouense]|uniref:CoA transferase subunit A n=1 Tax=Propylenella binzhouense TaxID=2555902 RepID=UPI00136C5556|nr:CoA-transferase [Propylenella binzhouense]